MYPRSSMSEEDKKWRAEDDLRTLRRAEEIKQDKERMTEVSKCVKDQMAALSSVAKHIPKKDTESRPTSTYGLIDKRKNPPKKRGK